MLVVLFFPLCWCSLFSSALIRLIITLSFQCSLSLSHSFSPLSRKKEMGQKTGELHRKWHSSSSFSFLRSNRTLFFLSSIKCAPPSISLTLMASSLLSRWLCVASHLACSTTHAEFICCRYLEAYSSQGTSEKRKETQKGGRRKRQWQLLSVGWMTCCGKLDLLNTLMWSRPIQIRQHLWGFVI